MDDWPEPLKIWQTALRESARKSAQVAKEESDAKWQRILVASSISEPLCSDLVFRSECDSRITTWEYCQIASRIDRRLAVQDIRGYDKGVGRPRGGLINDLTKIAIDAEDLQNAANKMWTTLCFAADRSLHPIALHLCEQIEIASRAIEEAKIAMKEIDRKLPNTFGRGDLTDKLRDKFHIRFNSKIPHPQTPAEFITLAWCNSGLSFPKGNMLDGGLLSFLCALHREAIGSDPVKPHEMLSDLRSWRDLGFK